MMTSPSEDDNKDIEALQKKAQKKDRRVEKLEYRQQHGENHCYVCNVRLGATDPLNYVCAEHMKLSDT